MNALRSALCVGAAIVILAGCGGVSGTPMSPSPAGPSMALRMTTLERSHVRPAYGVIYSFKGFPKNDGGNPYSGLTNVNGTLYGTTEIGGTKNVGTVFAISTAGSETVLGSFAGSRGGADPKADLAYISGKFYGTTTGGTSSKGTVFTYSSSKQSTLHNFNGKDGATPTAGISHANNSLYARPQTGAHTTLERPSRSPRRVRKPCCTVSANMARRMARPRPRPSTISRARFTARPHTGAHTARERSTRSRLRARTG